MGFFGKLWNLMKGRGWKEDRNNQQEEEIQEEEEKKRLEENLQETENKIQKEMRVAEKKPDEKKEVKETKKEPKEKKEKKIKEKSKEVKNAVGKYKQSGKISDIEKKLSEGTIGQQEFTPTNDLGALKNIYNGLLRRSTISIIDKNGNVDQALIDVLIENRGKIQHRFSAEIRILTDGGEGHMTIDGILAEHLSSIGDFIQVGMTYTSQELKTAMENAQTFFEKQYGSIGGSIIAPMNNKVTVQDIQVKMTFA